MSEDARTFAAFYAREYPVMLRVASLIVGDVQTAEDVVHEGFARAYARWGRLSRYDKPGAWLRLVVVRLAVRDRARPDTPIERANQDDPLAGLVNSDPVLAAVRALPRPERSVVVLHYLCDQSVAEVARTLRVRPGTVRVQLHRARARLAEELKEEAERAR